MTPESVYFLSTNKALSQEEFLALMDQLGSIMPPVMSDVQLVTLFATILGNYLDPMDEETMDRLTTAAVDTVLGHEMAVQLDLAVGPEDGVN